MSLFETGKDSLISEFKEHLAKHSQTIPAITVLDALTNDEGTPLFPNYFIRSLI